MIVVNTSVVTLPLIVRGVWVIEVIGPEALNEPVKSSPPGIAMMLFGFSTSMPPWYLRLKKERGPLLLGITMLLLM